MPLVTPLRPDDLRRVGRYRLSGRIADSRDDPNSAGIFLSRLPDGTPVAVTLLGRTAAPDPASRDRFTAEATVARRVAPFCAARILDAGFDGGQPFLVCEFIEGPSLAETVAAEGPLEGPVLAALAIGMATGLTSIHQAGLVHGDFGPDHVVLGAEGPRVVHFATTPPY
ncbi:MAG TPA: serine/threonine protein kinase, partial [Streptosporangiaceae bacterium]